MSSLSPAAHAQSKDGQEKCVRHAGTEVRVDQESSMANMDVGKSAGMYTRTGGNTHRMRAHTRMHKRVSRTPHAKAHTETSSISMNAQAYERARTDTQECRSSRVNCKNIPHVKSFTEIWNM